MGVLGPMLLGVLGGAGDDTGLWEEFGAGDWVLTGTGEFWDWLCGDICGEGCGNGERYIGELLPGDTPG